MKERHLVALSGGKDSAALAVYMRENYRNLEMEYVFIDSGCELPETYEYLNRIKAILDIDILIIGGASKEDRKDFAWWLKQKNNYLPSPTNRWCTEVLKLAPYAKWLQKECADTIVHSYVGLRADEKRERTGYSLCHDRLVQHHPFVIDGLTYNDVRALLEYSGIGFPGYYEWRSRSGCFFCFYQTKREWIGLFRQHPDKFQIAAEMEKTDPTTGKRYTWCDGLTLYELLDKTDEIESKRNAFVHGLDRKPRLSTTLERTISVNATQSCRFIRGG